MGGSFGGSRQTVTTYSGLQVQTTSSATAIPIVWGETMLTPTVIDYEGFHPKKKAAKSGGKGGVGNAVAGIFGVSGETVYYCDILMAVCEGPISDVTAVYQTSWSPISLSQAGLSLEPGTLGQAPLSYWTAHYPASALGYSGIAYLSATNFDLGPSATVGTNNLVVQGQLRGSGFNGIDADPAQVIYDFLTNLRYGVGFPSAEISGLTGVTGDASLQSYCHAAGLAFSPALIEREAANSILDRWLQILNCTCVWSSGVLKFIPRGDTALSANSWSFVPNLTIQAAFTDDGYYAAKGDTSDPVNIARANPYDIDNYLTLEILSRGNNYNSGPIPAQDQSAINRYGLRVGSSISAHEICDPAVAVISAQLILQRQLYVRNTYTWRASWEFCWLDPMDLVTLTDTRIGLATTTVRITAIEEDDLGILTFTAEEFPLGVATAIAYATQAASNGAPDIGVVPASVNAPLVFEPPSGLTGGALVIYAAVSPIGADPNWGGTIANASFDGVTYAAVATLRGPSTMGVTTAALAAYSGANPDNTNTLSVNLSESDGALLSTTAPNAAGGSTALWLNGEIVSFTTATLTSPNNYALTGLYRGLYGTAPAGAASGTPVALLSGALIEYDLPANHVGQTIYLKFQSLNLFGGQLQPLTSCTVYTYTILGSGLVSGAWSTYSPTWNSSGGSAPSIGNGALTGSYYAPSSTVDVTINLTVGSTTTSGSATSWGFSVPRAATATGVGTYILFNSVGAQMAHGTVTISAGASQVLLYDSTAGLVSAATYTLAAGEQFAISISYQA